LRQGIGPGAKDNKDRRQKEKGKKEKVETRYQRVYENFAASIKFIQL
jgi:hypothetical protein